MVVCMVYKLYMHSAKTKKKVKSMAAPCKKLHPLIPWLHPLIPWTLLQFLVSVGPEFGTFRVLQLLLHGLSLAQYLLLHVLPLL